jgi:hypothetical protein
VAGVLRREANAPLRSDSYLGAATRSLRTGLGTAKAIKAMAHYLACIIYRLFTRGQAWADRRAEHFVPNRQTCALTRLQAQAGWAGIPPRSITDSQA